MLGFIDVPGHEKFLSNMLAGVGGIDHALLVVACDDGVMAQTREHLQILQLTGNLQLTVALTKADRVDEARIGEVREEVLAALDNYASPIPFYLSPPPMKDAVLQNFALIYSSFLHVRTPRSIASVWLSTVRLR